MHFLEAYRFPFRSPNWALNILIFMVALLFVPVVGPMVAVGYQMEVVQALHLRGNRSYPDFDFNRLLTYLLRGLWVVLAQLILYLPALLVLLIAFVPLLFGVILPVNVGPASAGGGATPPVSLIILATAASVLYGLAVIAVGVLLSVVLVPVTLRAGLMQDLGSAFSWTFIRDFLRRVGWATALGVLVFSVLGSLIALAGMLVFCVGMYPAAAYAQFATAYLWYELYELYLQRGGMEIPLVAEAPPRPRVVYDED